MIRPLLVAFGLLGVALWCDNGGLGPVSLPLVLATCAIVGAVIAGRRLRWARLGLDETLVALLVIDVALVWLKPPGVYLDDAALGVRVLVTTGGLGAAAVALTRRAVPGWLALVAVLAIAGAAGLLVIHGSPSPTIDVFTIQQEGARALWHGTTPYGGPFTNPYTAEQTLAFFGAPHDHLTHYPYPPLSLLVTAGGWRLTDDVRHALLLVQLATGAALYAIARRCELRPGHAVAVVALFLLQPRGLFVLEQSWTEPLICAGFATTLLLLLAPVTRARQLALVGALAWLFAAKQYSVLLLPVLVARKFSTAGWLVIAAGLAIAAAVVVPFLVADPHALVADVVLFQIQQPFRWASLSIAPVIAFLSGWQPSLLGPLGAVGAMAWSWRRVPAGPHGLCLVASATLLVFFVAAKQAFCNYYYFAGLVLLCTALTAPRADAAPTSAA